MSIGRTLRTTRYMTGEQWANRLACRGRFAMMQTFPQAAHRRISTLSGLVPFPDLSSRRLEAAARHVIQLQQAVHGEFVAGVPDGRFQLLNREIDFGGIDHVDWRVELGEGNNRLWRMNLAYMGYLVPLFEIAPRSGLNTACRLLAGMKSQNPWTAKGVFRDVWHPYAVSHRVINLLTCLSLLDNSGVVYDRCEVEPLIAEVKFGAAFVFANMERDLQYNHILKNYVCLAFMAAAASEKIGFANREMRGIRAAIRHQFLPDGGHAERSPMYHLLSVLDLRILRDSGSLSPEDQTYVSNVLTTCEGAVNAMIHPNGDVALFNDSWLGEAPRAADMIEGLERSPANPMRLELAETGYVRLCQGLDNAVFDCGACGPDDNPGHAHADFLSVEVAINAEKAVVDCGVPTYSQGKLRDYSRSASAHNGPCFDGMEPIEFWSSFRIGRRGYAHKLALAAGDELVCAGWHDGYAPVGGLVARALRLLPQRGLLIIDVWAGANKRSATSNILIGDSWRKQGDLSFVNQRTGTVLRLTALEGNIPTVEAAPYWERFGVEHTGTRAVLAPVTGGKLRVAGLWLDWSGRETDPSPEWKELRAALIDSFQPIALHAG